MKWIMKPNGLMYLFYAKKCKDSLREDLNLSQKRIGLLQSSSGASLAIHILFRLVYERYGEYSKS